jgi:hemerythrin superfamily protein
MTAVSPAHQRLSDDHDAVGDVLKQLLTALDNYDVKTSYSKLDLLWARLAVHIRAEHLHLFPAVTSRLPEAQVIVEDLRIDHDFFMRELARAIGILRELSSDAASHEAKLKTVGQAVREVEKRLVTHNEIEEDQIYGSASIILTESELSELLARINAELENRPPRFSKEAWANLL